MKGIGFGIIALTVFVATSAYAESHVSSFKPQDRDIQLGTEIILPYRADDPSGRSATLWGVHAEVFPKPSWSIGMEGIIGVEDEGFKDVPVYLAPGFGFYPAPGRTFEPYIRTDVPILLNNGKDAGLRGGLGVLWNIPFLGLGLKYSFDVAYYFDQESTILDLANISAVVNW